MNRPLIKLTAALFAANTLLALAEPTLKVGDPAPKLQVGKWVQGDPVKEFARGKAYLVEFWATWCGPCRVSIPHLNEIHHQYKDKGLVVIGQDCWEQDEKEVDPFLKSMGDKMTYRVALDDKNGSEKGKMADTWMTAADCNGIPTAFLVDPKGMIAWIGHPMELKTKVIEEVLMEKFDLKKAAADYAKQKKNEAEFERVSQELGQAMQKQDWDAALAKVAEAEKLMPDEARSSLDMVRINISVGKKDFAGANKLAAKLSDNNKDNAMLQNELAWQMATDPRFLKRDLELIETIATRANDAAKGRDPNILDTLARALFMNSKKDKAVELQKKAVQLAEGPQKEELQKTLDSYKKGVLPKVE